MICGDKIGEWYRALCIALDPNGHIFSDPLPNIPSLFPRGILGVWMNLLKYTKVRHLYTIVYKNNYNKVTVSQVITG